MNNYKIGLWGENQAEEYIKKLGYLVIEKNYHTRYGEIDIIAKDNDCLVFIEVKTRKNNFFGNACEYVDAKKQKKLILTAEQYIQDNPDIELRFDVIEVYYSESYDNFSLKNINHIKNAFIT